MKKTIPLNKRFLLPDDLKYVTFGGKILAVFPSLAKWIVLDDDSQVDFLNLLMKFKIEDSLKQFHGKIDSYRNVVTQIVARQIDGASVKSCVSDDTKQLHFYLTNGCNLKCPHCYMFSGKKEAEELNTKEVLGVLDCFSANGGRSVTFSGGEVTMRTDLIQIVERAYDLGLRIRLLTNGVLWSENMIDSLSPFLDAIQISIDGFSEYSNSKIRGKKNFVKSLNTVDRFVSRKVATEVAITPPFDSAVADESKEYIDFCNKLLVQYPADLFKIKIAEQIIDGRKVHLSHDEENLYYKYVAKIKSAINGWESELESFVRAFGKDEIMDNCMYGVFAVDSKGDVYLCSRISSIKPIGNIKKTPFAEIKRISEKAQQLSKIDNFRPCMDCELKYICGGGCRIDFFPGFTDIVDVDNVNFEAIAPRNCSQSIKNRFYKLMIESNHRLFR